MLAFAVLLLTAMVVVLSIVGYIAAIASTAGDTVHITGESGAGKEQAAREFHRAGPWRCGWHEGYAMRR